MQPGDDIGEISNVIQTEQDCCDVCHAVEDCVKFTFERSNKVHHAPPPQKWLTAFEWAAERRHGGPCLQRYKECSLHYAYAEQTSSQSMISGEIRARYGDARISKPGEA
mmetsp:Transcript_25405/g.44631  ORF Transcript_25405/g.44631 Transcript_25405/m.44631 type:complete len:109 (+) Transcript_25405:274-600(+)